MKVASARDRCTLDELAETGSAGDREFGPLLLLKVRHPARLHWRFMLANLVMNDHVPVPFSTRRKGDFCTCWMIAAKFARLWCQTMRRRMKTGQRLRQPVWGRWPADG